MSYQQQLKPPAPENTIQVNNPILDVYPFHENHMYSSKYQRNDIYGNSIPRGYDQSNYSGGGNLYSNDPTYLALPQFGTPPNNFSSHHPGGEHLNYGYQPQVPDQPQFPGPSTLFNANNLGGYSNSQTAYSPHSNHRSSEDNSYENNNVEGFEITPDNSISNGVLMKANKNNSNQITSIDKLDSSYDLIDNKKKDNSWSNLFLIITLFVVFFIAIDFWRRTADKFVFLKIFGGTKLTIFQMFMMSVFFTILFILLIYMTGVDLRLFEKLLTY